MHSHFFVNNLLYLPAGYVNLYDNLPNGYEMKAPRKAIMAFHLGCHGTQPDREAAGGPQGPPTTRSARHIEEPRSTSTGKGMDDFKQPPPPG